MAKSLSKKSLGLVATVAVATSTSVLATPATDNPFALNELASGYNLASNQQMASKNNEGACGAAKPVAKEQKDAAKTKAQSEGACGAMPAPAAPPKAEAEGKCGEGKCGGSMKM